MEENLHVPLMRRMFSCLPELLNEELNGISDKENALILAGLNLANKCLNPSGESINIEGLDLLLEKVDKALKT